MYCVRCAFNSTPVANDQGTSPARKNGFGGWEKYVQQRRWKKFVIRIIKQEVRKITSKQQFTSNHPTLSISSGGDSSIDPILLNPLNAPSYGRNWKKATRNQLSKYQQ